MGASDVCLTLAISDVTRTVDASDMGGSLKTNDINRTVGACAEMSGTVDILVRPRPSLACEPASFWGLMHERGSHESEQTRVQVPKRESARTLVQTWCPSPRHCAWVLEWLLFRHASAVNQA